MQKKAILIVTLLGLWFSQAYAQPTGYYNGTEDLTGDELKTALNEIISDHVQYSYYASKTIFKLSDVDPENPDNVILIYTGRSHPNNDYGTGGNQINREHVWAKSHGNFSDVPPMDNDVHNLKPADASVNNSRSNKDFDNGGEQHPEATGCYFTEYTWEARDEVKGDVARIIFYMDTRYEGNNGELNLTVVDEINTYPLPEHGKLSTLLEWNEMDPPDEFERNRNNVIFSWQKNRNPFIDNPEYANLIWGNQQASAISFSNFNIDPSSPVENQNVDVNVTVTGSQAAITGVTLFWGLDYETLNNELTMDDMGNDNYTVEIPGQNGSETVYYKIVASDGTITANSIVYNYYVSPVFSGTITSIYDIQGQTEISPYEGEIVSTTGIVTANFGDNYFIQDGYGEWNGLFIYDPGRNPSLGDSVVITGLIEEYYDKTELKEVSALYHISANNSLPEPAIISSGDGSEPYESVLVSVDNAVCTDDDYLSNFYMWKVNDGSGEMLVHNTSIFVFEPTMNDSYKVTGPLNYDFDEWKIELRFENDVLPAVDLIPPAISEVETVSDTVVKILFTETVEEVSAETIDNYFIDNNIEIKEAKQHTLQKAIVYLTVSEMETGDYTILIENISDLAGNVMDNDEAGFSHQSSGINDLFSTGDISIYPNPASDYFILDIPSYNNLDNELLMTISNLSGQTILTKHFNLHRGGGNYEVNTDAIKKGMYIIKIRSTGKTGVQKLIIK